MEEFIPSQLLNKRSQDLPVYYRLNGAIYVADVDEFRKYRGFFMPNSRAYVMPAECSVDIDTEMDFKLSQLLLEKNE